MLRKGLLISLIISMFIAGCSTDFDLTEDFKEIAVVYGLLDQTQDVQYIRIHKAFIDETTSALLLAEDPDQLYYGNELVVKIEVYNGSSLLETINLERVDGDTIGISKAGGVFASSPNILYRFDKALNEDYVYKLVATNTNTGYEFSASTGLVKDFATSTPRPPAPPVSIPANWTSKLTFRWASAVNGVVYNLNVRFYYSVYNVSRSRLYIDSIDWENVFVGEESSTALGGETMFKDVQGSSFFNYMKQNYQSNDILNEYAILDSMSYEYVVGAETLYEFITINNITASSIASDNIRTEYTNVNNGLGIFSARYYKEVKWVHFDKNTKDSLACGSITSGIGFAPDFHPLWPSCP